MTKQEMIDFLDFECKLTYEIDPCMNQEIQEKDLKATENFNKKIDEIIQVLKLLVILDEYRGR